MCKCECAVKVCTGRDDLKLGQPYTVKLIRDICCSLFAAAVGLFFTDAYTNWCALVVNPRNFCQISKHVSGHAHFV